MGDLTTRAAALEELLAATEAFASRKPATVRGRAYEVDVWADPGDLDELAHLLEPLGFAAFRGARQNAHRFFLQLTEDGWGKVDAKVTRPVRPGVWSDLIWLGRRRRGLVVAVLGPDGAGKTTLIDRLAGSLPFATRVVYLGWRRGDRSQGGRAGPVAGSTAPFRRPAALVRWAARTALALWAIHLRARRGDVVLCDRHPIEAGTSLSGEPRWVRLSKRAVVRVLPRPDLVLLLAAPARTLHARKGEHRVEFLEEMAEELSRRAQRHGGVRIDATAHPDRVLSEAEGLIWERLRERRR